MIEKTPKYDFNNDKINRGGIYNCQWNRGSSHFLKTTAPAPFPIFVFMPSIILPKRVGRVFLPRKT